MACVPFAETRNRSTLVNIYVRHDIDTAQCILRMESMLDIDRSFDVQAGVFFRADDQEYSLLEHREAIQTARRAGFEVGLHTVCYLQDDPLRELKRETEKFAGETGFRPRSFTVHGLGRERIEARLKFYEDIAARSGEFGYEFSDCHSKWRTYDYVIEDCHWDEARKARYIYDDFRQPPSFLDSNKNCLILTHPCYWQV